MGVKDTRDMIPALGGLSVSGKTRWATLSARSLLDIMSSSMGRLEGGEIRQGKLPRGHRLELGLEER